MQHRGPLNAVPDAAFCATRAVFIRSRSRIWVTCITFRKGLRASMEVGRGQRARWARSGRRGASGRLSDHRIICGSAGARVGAGDGLIASVEQPIGGARALPLVRLFLSPVRQSLTSSTRSWNPHACLQRLTNWHTSCTNFAHANFFKEQCRVLPRKTHAFDPCPPARCKFSNPIKTGEISEYEFQQK